MSNSIATPSGVNPAYTRGVTAVANQSSSPPGSDPVKVEADAASVQGAAIDMQRLEKEVKRANTAMEAQKQDIAFSIDRDANSVVIKIINRSDRQLVKQIPSEQMLDFMHRVNAALEEKSSAGMLIQGEA